MQEPGPAEVAKLCRVQAEDRPDPGRGLGDPLGVARGERRLGVDDPPEGLSDEVEAIVVCQDDLLGRLECRHVGGHVGRRDLLPERGVGGDVLEEPHECRVEPGAATAASDVCRRLRPAGREEDLRCLRQPDEPTEQRDLLAAQAGRLASPVPVLVGRGHRDHGRVGEGQELEDLGAAIAAQPDELVAEARAAPRDGRHPARPLERRAGRRSDDVPHRLTRAVPVDPLQAALEAEVVAPDDLRHAGRGAGAAHVLQQKGVEERRASRRRRGRAHPRAACRSCSSAPRAPSAAPRSGRWRARAPR